ncbi:MAG TPA: hypothetical protein VNL71_14470, partial [Chloroflexota bacterium]|nr:hypothetical protein [Chloroflexota bacterium]
EAAPAVANGAGMGPGHQPQGADRHRAIESPLHRVIDGALQGDGVPLVKQAAYTARWTPVKAARVRRRSGSLGSRMVTVGWISIASI